MCCPPRLFLLADA